jgi:hypothetical protein
MRLLFGGFLLIALMATGCAGMSLSPQEREAREAAELRAWLRGPLMGTCSGLPGPESRRGCLLSFGRAIDQSNGVLLTREDHFRVELAKSKAFDETRQLWTRAENEAWLRGPRTTACQQAPSPTYVLNCLEFVQKDLDGFRHTDDIAVDPPEIRAERAVARIEANEQKRERERQRAHESEAARTQALGMFLGSGGFQSLRPAPIDPAVAYPIRPVRPPVNCTTNMIGSSAYTNCY